MKDEGVDLYLACFYAGRKTQERSSIPCNCTWPPEKCVNLDWLKYLRKSTQLDNCFGIISSTSASNQTTSDSRTLIGLVNTGSLVTENCNFDTLRKAHLSAYIGFNHWADIDSLCRHLNNVRFYCRFSLTFDNLMTTIPDMVQDSPIICPRSRGRSHCQINGCSVGCPVSRWEIGPYWSLDSSTTFFFNWIFCYS